ncbi:hypothetical protein D047_0678A, partial [Vibrio parahaemolyticus VPTS-2010_2]
MVEANLFCV